MANEKIVFDGDPEPLIRANKKSQEEIKKTRKEARTLTQEVEMMGKGWLKSVIGITAAASAVRALVNANRELRTERETQDKARGGSALGISVALAGRRTQDISAVTTAAESAQDPEAAAKFIAGLAGNRKAKRLSAQQLQAIAVAAGSGLFTDAELQESIKRGRAPDMAKRLNELSPEARSEFDIRQIERQNKPFQFAGSTAESRERTAAYERQKQESLALRFASAVTGGLSDEYGRNLTETASERGIGRASRAERLSFSEKGLLEGFYQIADLLGGMKKDPQIINPNGER
jgi:hypothetical protein